MEKHVLNESTESPAGSFASGVVSKRVRIFFIGCPTLDTAAASHLLLSQNAAQKAIQFEIYHFWIFAHRTAANQKLMTRLHEWYCNSGFPFSRWLSRRYLANLDYRQAPAFKAEISRDSWFAECKQVLKKYDRWFPTQCSTNDVEGCPTIIITEAAIKGGFISLTNDDIGLISTAKWTSYFKPVSGLDYILFSVQRLTARLAYTGKVGSHYPTRGCLWDYNPHQPDARIGILLGHICETCQSKLVSASNRETFEEIAYLCSNRWLGDKDTQFTPAAILAHVHRYDLSRSTGLNTNFFTRTWDSVSTELGKAGVEAVKWTLVLIFSLTLAAYFPEVLKRIKDQLVSSEPARKAAGGEDTARSTSSVPNKDLKLPIASAMSAASEPKNEQKRPSLPPDRGSETPRPDAVKKVP